MREKDIEEGELLPKDIRLSYRSYIKAMIKRKRDDYIRDYDINAESKIYTIYDPSHQLAKMREKGIFSTKIAINF